jgi:hypothetical protein
LDDDIPSFLLKSIDFLLLLLFVGLDALYYYNGYCSLLLSLVCYYSIYYYYCYFNLEAALILPTPDVEPTFGSLSTSVDEDSNKLFYKFALSILVPALATLLFIFF